MKFYDEDSQRTSVCIYMKWRYIYLFIRSPYKKHNDRHRRHYCTKYYTHTHAHRESNGSDSDRQLMCFTCTCVFIKSHRLWPCCFLLPRSISLTHSHTFSGWSAATDAHTCALLFLKLIIIRTHTDTPTGTPNENETERSFARATAVPCDCI